MNTHARRIAYLAAAVMLLASTACSVDIAGLKEEGACDRALREDGVGGFEVYCAQDLPDRGRDERSSGI